MVIKKIHRLSSYILLPLLFWLVFSLSALPDFRYITLVAWIGQGYVFVLLNIIIISVVIHSYLGFEEIFTDYIHGAKSSQFSHNSLKIVMLVILVIALLSLNRLYILT